MEGFPIEQLSFTTLMLQSASAQLSYHMTPSPRIRHKPYEESAEERLHGEKNFMGHVRILILIHGLDLRHKLSRSRWAGSRGRERGAKDKPCSRIHEGFDKRHDPM